MSEERNQIHQEQSSNLATLAEPGTWEAQLQARAKELLAQRVAPLKAEIERLQASVSEISSRLTEHENGIAEEDSSSLLDSIKQWFHDSNAKAEEDFNSRLDRAREEAAAAAREEARAAAEQEFQARIEQACADAASVARRESEAQLEDLREQLEASRKALTLTVASAQQTPAQGASFDAFKTAVEDIDSQRTQSDTLTALVRRASQFAPRVAFFVIKSGDAVGWKASGFENGLNDETVKLLTVSSRKRTILSDAIASYRTVTNDPHSESDRDSAVLGLYSSPVPERAIAIPLIVFNKAAAVLYVDSGTQPESAVNTAAAESLMRITGRTIELLLSRRGAEPARAPVPQPQITPPAQENAFVQAPKIEETAAQPPAVQTDNANDEHVAQAEAAHEIPMSPASEPEVHPEIHAEEQAGSEKEASSAAAAAAESFYESNFGSERIETAAPVTADEAADQKHKTEELPPLPEPVRQPEIHEPASNASFYEPAAIHPEPALHEPAAHDEEKWSSAEAQLHDPEYPAAEPSVWADSRRVTKDVTGIADDSEIGASYPPPGAPSAFAQRPFGGENNTAAPTMPMSDFNVPPVENRSSAPEIAAFQSPPAPPVFTPPVEAPRPAQPITSVPTPGSETEQRAHNDARRFARLLVSEIKLYNAAKVNDGRRNYDLYDRLKDEIDRSRKVYDKRVSPAVAARFDYFYDELVQTLAEGDPAKLGKNCPGPVVLA